MLSNRNLGPLDKFVLFLVRVMRFVIPVVLYEVTNVECVYWSDTAIFIGRI